MKKARILSIAFGSMSQTAFLIKAGEISLAIHAPGFADDFPDINPSAADIAIALEEFRTAVATESSKTVAALRRATRARLADLLVILALDLEQKAGGDMVKLSRTGYDINKSPGSQTTTKTPTPENLRLFHYLRGQTLAKVKAMRGKVVFIGAYTYDPINGPWITTNPFTSSQKILFTGLERGRDVYVKVMAVGPHGPSDWSDVAVIMVQ